MKNLIFYLLTIFLISCNVNQPVNTPEIKPLITLTALPSTLNAMQKREMVAQYLINNNNCVLPCYWGIIPGETTWEEARVFLDDFWKSYIEEGNGSYRVRFEYPEPENEGRYYYLYLFTNPENNNTIVTIKGSLDNSLKSFLSNNGEPERIFLRSIGEHPETFHYLLYLYYGEKGVWAKQTLRNDGYEDHTNEKLRVCTKSDIFFDNSNRSEGIEVVLWNPATDTISGDNPVKVFDDISEMYVLKPIEDGTGMNASRFYNEIVNNNGDYCFSTNTDNWQPTGELLITPEN